MNTESWKATKPGCFTYHCAPGGAMIPYHVTHGMNGAIMVLPRDGLKDAQGNPLRYDSIAYFGEQDYYLPKDEKGDYRTYEAAGDDYADSLEATTFGSMLEGFARIAAVATCCSSEIIEDVVDGRFLLAYNVLGSYVESRNDPNVGVILPEDYTLVLSRGFMIPREAANPDGAARLLEFLLSDEAQAILTEIGLVMPSDPSETGLLPSARRFIGLSPALLVALDG